MKFNPNIYLKLFVLGLMSLCVALCALGVVTMSRLFIINDYSMFLLFMVVLCGFGVFLFSLLLTLIYRMGFSIDNNGVYSKAIRTSEYNGFIPWTDISDVICLSNNPKFPFIRFKLRRGKTYTGVGIFKSVLGNNKACFDVPTKLYWSNPTDIIKNIQQYRRKAS